MTQPQTEFLQLKGPPDATWTNYDAREIVRTTVGCRVVVELPFGVPDGFGSSGRFLLVSRFRTVLGAPEELELQISGGFGSRKFFSKNIF